MPIEHRLQFSLIEIERTNNRPDVVEPISMNFDERQNLTAHGSQFLLRPDHARDGQFNRA